MRVQESIRMLFFFSSRRRHTRLQGDWSSDVCSSDLVNLLDSGATLSDNRHCKRAPQPVRLNRSEERRVGEEGRFRWAPCLLKKKKKPDSPTALRWIDPARRGWRWRFVLPA